MSTVPSSDGSAAGMVRSVARGCLVLVVGPSGAGKDSIMDGAQEFLAGDEGFEFVRREITRPADAGGEDHIPVPWDHFRQRAVDGTYALAWEAHGNGYGVPAAALCGLEQGRSAIVNVSRGILQSARSRFSPLRIINISVPADILAQRLSARGRETAEEVAKRLQRADAYRLDGSDVLSLMNDGPLSRSVDAFVGMLRSAASEKG